MLGRSSMALLLKRPTLEAVTASSSEVLMETEPVAFQARAKPSVAPWLLVLVGWDLRVGLVGLRSRLCSDGRRTRICQDRMVSIGLGKTPVWFPSDL